MHIRSCSLYRHLIIMYVCIYAYLTYAGLPIPIVVISAAVAHEHYGTNRM